MYDPFWRASGALVLTLVRDRGAKEWAGQPPTGQTELSEKRIIVGKSGCAPAGLVSAAFYALAPAWMQDEGIAHETIAIFMCRRHTKSELPRS
jgi:hypothetical protein